MEVSSDVDRNNNRRKVNNGIIRLDRTIDLETAGRRHEIRENETGAQEEPIKNDII